MKLLPLLFGLALCLLPLGAEDDFRMQVRASMQMILDEGLSVDERAETIVRINRWAREGHRDLISEEVFLFLNSEDAEERADLFFRLLDLDQLQPEQVQSLLPRTMDMLKRKQIPRYRIRFLMSYLQQEPDAFELPEPYFDMIEVVLFSPRLGRRVQYDYTALCRLADPEQTARELMRICVQMTDEEVSLRIFTTLLDETSRNKIRNVYLERVWPRLLHEMSDERIALYKEPFERDVFLLLLVGFRSEDYRTRADAALQLNLHYPEMGIEVNPAASEETRSEQLKQIEPHAKTLNNRF